MIKEKRLRQLPNLHHKRNPVLFVSTGSSSSKALSGPAIKGRMCAGSSPSYVVAKGESHLVQESLMDELDVNDDIDFEDDVCFTTVDKKKKGKGKMTSIGLQSAL